MLNPDIVMMGFCTVVLGTLLLFGICVQMARINRLQYQMLTAMQQLRAALLEQEEGWQ